MNSDLYFRKNRIKFLIFVLFIVALTKISSNLLEFNFYIIFENFQNATSRFVRLYFPANFESLQKLLEGVWVSFILAVSSGMVGSLLASIAALFMSKKTFKNKIVRSVIRIISTFIRNIPSTIWAIILLISFWYGEFLGFLVMTLGTFGFNARVFSDIFDEADSNSIEALNSVGANNISIIGQSIIPNAWPSIVSWTLYAIETNIRDSVIIGMLAGGGIGQLIDIYRNFRRFDELTSAVILIVALVLIFDRLSIVLREKLQW